MYEPERNASPSDVLHILAKKSGMDGDGYSFSNWLEELAKDDLFSDLLSIIIKNKKEPAVAPLFDMVCMYVSAILDQEIYDGDIHELEWLLK